MGSTDKDWELWGQDDPYFGVLADEKFRRHNLSQETLRDFFASGEKHVNRLLGVIWQHLEANFNPPKPSTSAAAWDGSPCRSRACAKPSRVSMFRSPCSSKPKKIVGIKG